MEHGTQLSDEADAHDMPAVHPQEFVRVELRYESVSDSRIRWILPST
jgi:hypothetical protein